MRQRVMIAMALSCNPQLLIADEPTTALDVTTQAQVLQQISALQAEFRMAVILVTHDLGVVAETCRRAIVMYCGSIVEAGNVAALFSRPRHPYTAGLLASIPRLRAERLAELPVIPGRVPDLLNLPAARFADRCPRVQERCRVERPTLAAGGRPAPRWPATTPCSKTAEARRSGHRDLQHLVALLDGIDHIDALRHLAKDGVLPVQVGLRAVGDEELAAVGVGAGIGH